MSKIIGKKFKWVVSPTADVVATKLYICKDIEVLNYASPSVTIALPGNEYLLPGIFTMPEGNYKAAITAIDSSGNESDMAPAAGQAFFLDLTAPAVPTGLALVNA